MKKSIAIFALFLLMTQETFADTEFLRRLVDQPTVSVKDGIYMLTHFMGKGTEHPDFSSQKDYLQSQGVLAGSLSQKPEDAVLRRGELAELVMKALDLKGGIFLRLSGGVQDRGWLGEKAFQRYAFREAVFRGLMKEGNILAAVTGEELISVIRRMADYREEATGLEEKEAR